MPTTPSAGASLRAFLLAFTSLTLLSCGLPDTDAGATSSSQANSSSVSAMRVSTASLLDGEASLDVTKDADGAIETIAITLPFALIEGAPTKVLYGADPAVMDPNNQAVLPLPSDLQEASFVNHVTVDYNPIGHPPQDIYTMPHFDLHFYGIPSSEREAVDCNDLTAISADHLPEHYMSDAAGPPPQGGCVPKMGIHAANITSPEFDTAKKTPFSRTMILGSYKGSVTFVEPMVSRAMLLKKESFELDIPVPPALAPTRFPTRFRATYDPTTDVYRFAVSEFVEVW